MGFVSGRKVICSAVSLMRRASDKEDREWPWGQAHKFTASYGGDRFILLLSIMSCYWPGFGLVARMGPPTVVNLARAWGI